MNVGGDGVWDARSASAIENSARSDYAIEAFDHVELSAPARCSRAPSLASVHNPTFCARRAQLCCATVGMLVAT